MVLILACRIRRGSVGAGTGSDLGNWAYSVRTRPVLDWAGFSGIGSLRPAVAAVGAGSSACEGAASAPSARVAVTAKAAQSLGFLRRAAMRVPSDGEYG